MDSLLLAMPILLLSSSQASVSTAVPLTNCKNNGTLTPNGCICKHAYTGKHCEDYACVNGLSTGESYDPESVFFDRRCLCDVGWTGELCEESVLSTQCNGQGEMINSSCACYQYYAGAHCNFVTKCVHGQLSNGR
uniref:EGF-like domain-containing protein n=1 Tax=Plectus sambesii TaxID=2011161 RepID=A0A914X3Z5_9BILA